MTPTANLKKEAKIKGPSLCDKIKSAKTAFDVESLLAEGAKYQYASEKTRRRWQKVAKAKRESLAA